ncbi:MAG: exodeoxyribonuclease V subunit gamma, partial [Candidatus Obscuribacterales bacterium]|nr:exodeoxyribonuclease V subunit gamma [Candidatus Obscuribacterales bacterium]
MEEIARRVKANLVKYGLSAEQILVVVPSMRKYRGAIEAAFDDAALPYYLDESIALSGLPLVKFIVQLVGLSGNELLRSQVIEILRNDYFDLARFSLTVFDLERLDRISIAKKMSTFANLKRLDDVLLSEKLSLLFKSLIPPSGHRSLTEFVSFVEDLLDTCLIEQADVDHLDPMLSWSRDRALLEIRNCLAALVQEDIVLNGGTSGVKVDYAGFLLRFNHIIETANVRRVRTSIDPVTICSVDLAPNKKFSQVYIAGLVEGEFPRKSSQRGFVSSDEARRWLSFDIDLDNPRSHPGFEYALFRSLLSRATGNIILTLPMWDMSGDELLPSFFLTGELKELEIVELPPYLS